MNFDFKYFLYALLGITAILALSFWGFLVPPLNVVFFIGILLLVLVLALWKLELALYLVLAELFIGSFGYLLSWQIGGINLSLRIGMFLVIMAVWLTKVLIELIKNRSLVNYFKIRKFKVGKYFLLFGLVLIWGFVWGLAKNNGFNNIFFDFNGWIYLAYLLPFFDCFNQKKTAKILSVLAAAITVNFFLTFIVLIIFTQNFESLVSPLYTWIRDYRIGEITFAGGNLWRVFLQSQVYAAIGSVLFFFIWLKEYKYKLKIKSYEFALVVISLFTVIISLSRSFWLGVAGAFVLMFLYLLIKQKVNFKKLFIVGLLLIVIVGIEFGLIRLIAGSGSGELITKRITDTSEAAGASRWNQLRPLSKSIISHPVVGSGFGTQVTYQSRDPRVLKNSPDGWYTTYAFEWGYLDILLKIGLFGLIVYLLTIFKVIKNLRFNTLGVGLVFGLVVILFANIFTPYLNHPLGIGYLILISTLNK